MIKYEEPKMQIEFFIKTDIITSSDGSGDNVELPEIPIK